MQDVGSALGPDERLRFDVVMGDVLMNGGLKIDGQQAPSAPMDPASGLTAGVLQIFLGVADALLCL